MACIAGQTLHMVVAVAVVVVTVLPLTVACFVIPFGLSLHELLLLSLGCVLLLLQGKCNTLTQPIERALHELPVIVDMMGSHDMGCLFSLI